MTINLIDFHDQVLFRYNNYLKSTIENSLMKSSILILVLLLSVSTSAVVPVLAIKQEIIRPSYPFPTFLSTGPYVWYDNVKNKPIKGHTYRIATFSENQLYRIFIEKVEFGDSGCCLEIVDYRELIINEIFLTKQFPKNTGSHGFKLIRWLKPTSFEFQAYGGVYKLSEIDKKKPFLEEIKSK